MRLFVGHQRLLWLLDGQHPSGARDEELGETLPDRLVARQEDDLNVAVHVPYNQEGAPLRPDRRSLPRRHRPSGHGLAQSRVHAAIPGGARDQLSRAEYERAWQEGELASIAGKVSGSRLTTDVSHQSRRAAGSSVHDSS